MDLDQYITILTFIPWVLYIVVSLITNLNKEEYRLINFNYIRKNFFKIFRLDTLFLLIVFIYFTTFKMEFVLEYLFAIMCIYLFVNSFYEDKNKLKKGFFKENIISIILIFILILIPFIIYFKTKDIIKTYNIMLIYVFIEYILIIIASYIEKFLKKIFN